MVNMIENPTLSFFHRSGLAALSDLNNPEYQRIFSKLEKEQKIFLEKGSKFRSKEYKWPRDPLHTWSRVWEYPYVYYHLVKYFKKLPKESRPVVADLGSGVTFFPFSIAQIGYRVICLDNDDICAKDMMKAIKCVSSGAGMVEFSKVDSSNLPFEDGVVDAIYCISVLEHIEDFEKTIKEAARIIKHDGLFILTIDLDLLGNFELGVNEYRRLRDVLDKYFYYIYPETSVHPIDLLLSNTGPYPIINLSGINKARYLFKQYFVRPMLLRKPKPMPTPYKLALYGSILNRK